MFQESLGHMAERLTGLGDEVHLLDQRLSAILVFLGNNATATLNPSTKPESQIKIIASAALAKRVASLELGQRTVAAGTRRALRKAIAVQRSMQERRDSKIPNSFPEVSQLASNLKEQGWRIDALDDQVNLLATHIHGVFAERRGSKAPPQKEATNRFVRSASQDHASQPTIATPRQRSQMLVDIMEEAVAEAETEELLGKARCEADRLRAELLRVEAASRHSLAKSALGARNKGLDASFCEAPAPSPYACLPSRSQHGIGSSSER